MTFSRLFLYSSCFFFPPFSVFLPKSCFRATDGIGVLWITFRTFCRHAYDRSKHQNKTRKTAESLEKKPTESPWICRRFDAWGVWIREHDIKGFLCILSSVGDSVPDEPSSASGGSFCSVPGERRASAPGKRFMCTTTWEGTACLNINQVCLVTKHLSSGCSPAGAHRRVKAEGGAALPRPPMWPRIQDSDKPNQGSSHIPAQWPKYEIKKKREGGLISCSCRPASSPLAPEMCRGRYFPLWSLTACRMKRLLRLVRESFLSFITTFQESQRWF